MIRSEHTLSEGTRSEFTRDKKTIVRQRQESAAIGGDCPAGREMGVIPMLSVAPHARPSTARGNRWGVISWRVETEHASSG